MNKLHVLLKLLRPHQWLKNSFVLVGWLFGEHWHNLDLLQHALTMMVAFCLGASAVYIFNDLFDAKSDRQHPKKRHRPIASGQVSVQWAITQIIILLSASLVIAPTPAGRYCLLAYFVLNIAYTVRLKHVAILDVFLIALGFMLRIMAGTLAIGIPPSNWLWLCSLMLTLFLGFCKRRAELAALGDSRPTRRVLGSYNLQLLDLYIGINAACVIITYSLYTVSEHATRLHRGDNLIYTVPIVLYGLFRYLYVLQNKGGGQDTARDMLTDIGLQITALIYISSIFWILSR